MADILIVTKAIANMTFCQDISRAGRIVFYLFSELVDQNTEVFAFVTVLRSPYRGKETIMRHGTTCMLHEVTQHFKFLRSKVNLLSELFDTITAGIQYDVTDSDERVRWNGGCSGATNGSA